MAKNDEDILQIDPMKADKSTELDQGTAERVAHREHVKRMKQYKKKKKRKIIGLALECVLLLVVCAGLWGVNYVANAFDRMQVTTGANSTEPEMTDADASTPEGAYFVIEGPDGSTEYVPLTKPNLDTEPDTGNDTAADTAADTQAAGSTEEETYEDVPDIVKTGYSTFVVFGVDARDTETMERWTQGDVVILVSLNNETKEVRLCSVFRDSAFESETDSGLDKITDSYCRYGVQHTVEALNRNFDLNIDDYVVVNWTAVADVVDALDGIDMYLTAAEAEQMGWYVYETELATHRKYTVKGLPAEAGTYHLNGGQALAVARIRKGVGDDFGRTERQRKIISLILQKAKTMKLNQLYAILEAVTNNVRFSFDRLEVMSLAKDVFKYNITETSGYPFDRVAFSTATSMIFANDMSANVKQLHSFLYGEADYTPSSNVRRIGAYQEQAIEAARAKQQQQN